jgi:hypothetical protein
MRRRVCRSWQAISIRLSPACYEITTSSASLRPIEPRVSYRDAGVMMECADYAERNAPNLDHVVIAGLRNDALQIRIRTLRLFLTRNC